MHWLRQNYSFLATNTSLANEFERRKIRRDME